MKSKIIFSIKFIFALLFTVFLYACIGYVLVPKDTTAKGGQDYYFATAYMEEPENTLDFMMFGDSDLYSSIIPMQIYDEYGITSYNGAIPSQSMNGCYKQIKKVLKKQTPKVIMLEGDFFYYRNGGNGYMEYQNIVWKSIIKYHARWKELTAKDFTTSAVFESKGNYMKGYYYSNLVYDFEVPASYMSNPDAEPEKMKKSIVKDFDNIYNLCKEKGITLLIYNVPSPKSWSNARHNGLQKLVDEYNAKDSDYQINFIDTNGSDFDGEFDYSKSFRDAGDHCNEYGATVITKHLGKYLNEHYEFTDHRVVDVNEEWEYNYKLYKEYGLKN